MLMLFVKLLLAHSLGDFIFQPSNWVRDKEQKKVKSLYLYYHILVHLILLILILEFNPFYWLGILVILISHYCIDLIKLYFVSHLNRRKLFFRDQFAHLIILLTVTYFYSYSELTIDSLFYTKSILMILFIVLTTKVAAIFIKVFMSKWNEVNSPKEESLLDAGAKIGVLERLFVFTFVVFNHWAGIGFLLATKSVFRFGDISRAKNRKLTEYILIGTLTSFGIAIFLALSYLYFLEHIE
jgi:hypothetical protein